MKTSPSKPTQTEFDHDPYLKRIADLEVMVRELSEFAKVLMWGHHEGNHHERSCNLWARAQDIVTDNKSDEVSGW